MTDKRSYRQSIGSTKSGINMTAVADMGDELSRKANLFDMGVAKLVVFANAVEDNPFMARVFHEVLEAEMLINESEFLVLVW